MKSVKNAIQFAKVVKINPQDACHVPAECTGKTTLASSVWNTVWSVLNAKYVKFARHRIISTTRPSCANCAVNIACLANRSPTALNASHFTT